MTLLGNILMISGAFIAGALCGVSGLIALANAYTAKHSEGDSEND